MEVLRDKSAVVCRWVAFLPIARVFNTRLLISNFLESITSGEADSWWTIKKIHCIFWRLKVHCYVCSSLPLVCIMSQMNTVHNLRSHYFNIVLILSFYMCLFLEHSLRLRSSNQNYDALPTYLSPIDIVAIMCGYKWLSWVFFDM